MSQSSKVHHYPRSLRTVNMVNVGFCQDKAHFYITPPEDAISIETLYIHLKMTFAVGITASERVLKYIGVGSEIPLLIADDPTGYFNKVDLNLSADANRQVEVRLDLTSILKKDNVRYRSYFSDADTNDFTYIIIKTHDNNRGVTDVATIDICKVDAQFTTKGIA